MNVPLPLASILDYVLLLGYFLGIFALGWRTRASASDDGSSYLLAGRRLTLPAFVASLVSTWYGGILGVGEFAYLYGISTWLVFGVPYYLFAAIFALFIAKRARNSQLQTIPDQLNQQYDRRVALAGAFFIFMLMLPAPYLLMLGVLLQLLLAMPLWIAVLASAAFSMLYVLRGGLSAVIKTDIPQFALMFGGFILIVAFAAITHGGPAFLHAEVPKTHFVWHGGNSPAYIFVWYLIAMATLVDPNFYQRAYAAQTPDVARNGILIAILFWALFDFLTTTAGLYARALLPDLANPVESFPRLAQTLLPAGFQGLFFAGLFATIMSTVDSFGFLSATTFGRDILIALRSKPMHLERATAAGLVVAYGLAAALALLADSVVSIWYQLGSIVTPALLLPLMASYHPGWRLRPAAAFWHIVLAGGVSLGWIIAGWEAAEPFLGIEAIYPGLLVSLLVWVADRLGRRFSV